MKTKSTLKDRAAEHPEIAEWLKVNAKEFYQALGMWPFDDDAMVLALEQMKDCFGGRFKGYKDEIDQARCDVLMAFMRGEDKIDNVELRTAIALLIQSFNAACERLYLLDRRPPPQPNKLPRPRHFTPSRGGLVRSL